MTVFVSEDADRRRYSVDVLPAGQRTKWVTLGTATGTQSFSLSRGRVKSATAVRITDLSGRLRDGQFKPDAAPGVGIVGVGVRKIGDASCGGTLDKVVGAVLGILADGTEYRQVLANSPVDKQYVGADGSRWIAVPERVLDGKPIKAPLTLQWRRQR
jgi:hypothetical protein